MYAMSNYYDHIHVSIKMCERLCLDNYDPDDPEDNSNINKMSLPKVRVWIRYRARATAGVKGKMN